MLLLEPSRQQSLDVLSYFLPSHGGGGGREGEGECESGEEVLAELPVEGLKRRRRARGAVGVRGSRRGRERLASRGRCGAGERK